ncbi:MAG: hypothetical protein BWY52_02014 [Chloroflexi bacterium ADurb.Bin325]|nr:MAG: hypothetical protein BWY52_02014 [Chloroflexi bacterium ADurb.Bin325]
MLESFLPLHPRTVHFPIALTLVGVAFAALGLFRQRPQWIAYGQMNLLLGWLGALAAVATGLFDQSAAPQTPEVLAVINQHISAGIALLVTIGLALYWPLRNKRLWSAGRSRWGYLALLLLIVALIAVEGWLGGRLVYGLGVGVH